MNNEKVFFNTSFLGKKPTGIGNFIKEISRRLNSEQILFNQENDKLNFDMPNKLTSEFGIYGHLRRLIWTQFSLPYLLKKYKINYLFSPIPEAPLGKNIKTIIFVHDLIPLLFPELNFATLYYKFWLPKILNNSDLILCNSTATSTQINNIIGIPLNKIKVIPLGVKQKEKLKEKQRINYDFLILGRHANHKNIEAAIEALSLLKENKKIDINIRKKVKLIIIGTQKKGYTLNLIRLSLKLKINKDCEWINWIEDDEKEKYLKESFSLLIPSYWEGFGLTALEAMSFGTPIIASNRGALPEVIADCGIYIDPNKVWDISKAMALMISDISLYKNLSYKSKKRAEIFTWGKTAYLLQKTIEKHINY